MRSIDHTGGNRGRHTKQPFHHTANLPGHADWIRGLAFSAPLTQGCLHHEQREGDILLASASQDNFIRLWRIAKLDRKEASTGSPSTSALDILDQLDDQERDAEVAAKHYDLCMSDGRWVCQHCEP